MRKILAVASGGGHWEQMMVLATGLQGYEIVYATTLVGLAEKDGVTAAIVADCSRDRPLEVLRSIFDIFRLIVSVRPDIVMSTGAAPGLLAIIVARILGTKTLWVDSVANSERLSMSGRIASKVAHLCLTQWEHIALKSDAQFMGSVL